MKGNSNQRMSISKCLVFEKVPPEKWRYVCRFRKSGINTKCNRLLWGGTYMYQNETWFLRNLHPSSFFWKRSQVKIEGSVVSRAPYVGWRISAGLIDNSRFRVTGVTGIFFFDFYVEILLLVTCMPIFMKFALVLQEILIYPVWAQLINWIFVNSFVLHYIRSGSIWEPILLGFKHYHRYLQNTTKPKKSEDPHDSKSKVAICIAS